MTETNDIVITACDVTLNTLTVLCSVPQQSTSAKDHPCLVEPPDHNWYKNGIYMKCSKCGMSYETKPEKGLIL